MYLIDPTECADSARITASIINIFPHAEINPIGGVVYDLALMDILHNMDEDGDGALIDRLLRFDDRCIALGEFHHATAIAEKINPESHR